MSEQTWTQADEKQLREMELKLASLVVEETKLQAETGALKLRKTLVEAKLRHPVMQFVSDNWPFLPHTNVGKNVDRLTEWICSNRAALVPLLNKIDEAMK